jgi:hypothetical protein
MAPDPSQTNQSLLLRSVEPGSGDPDLLAEATFFFQGRVWQDAAEKGESQECRELGEEAGGPCILLAPQSGP